MIAVIVIAVCVCVGLIASVMLKPSVTVQGHTFSVYWSVPLVGAVLLLLCGFLGVGEVFAGLTAAGAMNPVKILILFFSMTILSVYLDEVGFFRMVANFALKKAKTSQTALFVMIYVTVSVLTVFTSNDVVVLTFTPFLCYFAKNAKIDPLPYLVEEFVAANTWSMALLIGNPTNIYLATSLNVDFATYFSVMWLPTLLSGLTSFGVLFLLFRKKLKAPLTPSAERIWIDDKFLVWIGILHLGGCLVLLVLSSYLDLSMWLICLCFAVSLFVFVGIYQRIKKRSWLIVRTLKRAPFEMIPFVLSMFVIVLALQKYGVTAYIGSFLAQGPALVSFGVSSFLAANIVNNIPMSVLFSSVVESLSGNPAAALYACIVGSNLGAYLTPIGALAGILWMSLLRRYGVKYSFLQFTKYGFLIAVPAMAAALLGLWVVL